MNSNISKNRQIYDFIQHLYKKYSIEDRNIEYGFNDSTGSFIVRINDNTLSSNHHFLSEISDFSSQIADDGYWIVFVFPNDILLSFLEFKPIEKLKNIII